jgi:hypothetical protein
MGPRTGGGALVDVGLGIGSLMAWLLSGSVSMLAAGVLTLAMGANQGIGLARGRRAMRLAACLFPAAALVPLMAGVDSMRGHHVVSPNVLGFAVLAIAFWLEGTPVLADDTGTLTGLVVALVGATVTALTGNARFDALGSIGVGLLLVVAAVALAADPLASGDPESADPGTDLAADPVARVGQR